MRMQTPMKRGSAGGAMGSSRHTNAVRCCEESDPYVAEIRAVRARLNKTANYDVATFAKHTADAVRSIGIQYCGLKPLKPQFDLLAGSAG